MLARDPPVSRPGSDTPGRLPSTAAPKNPLPLRPGDSTRLPESAARFRYEPGGSQLDAKSHSAFTTARSEHPTPAADFCSATRPADTPASPRPSTPRGIEQHFPREAPAVTIDPRSCRSSRAPSRWPGHPLSPTRPKVSLGEPIPNRGGRGPCLRCLREECTLERGTRCLPPQPTRSDPRVEADRSSAGALTSPALRRRLFDPVLRPH